MTFKPDAASISAIPQASTATPATEQIGGAAGTAPMRFSQEGHAHPRLTSTTYVTLGSTGQAFALFSRSFTNKPGLNLTETDAVAGSQPLVLRGLTWQQDANGKYYGVTVEGMRARALPQLSVVSGILTAVITGVNSIVTALTGYNVFGGSANGAVVSVIAVARSDVAST